MRMWMVQPQILCDQHLLGEHCEIHMFIGTLERGVKIDGYAERNLVEPCSFLVRHEELAEEMERRGMKHHSPLECKQELIEHLPYEIRNCKIDRSESLAELIRRCRKCRRNYIQFLAERKEAINEKIACMGSDSSSEHRDVST